ncbi:XRE family transcriptional regulator [Pedobacter frigidisoli]|uniref:XRE family transcriptional regulator n=1 Tax=Pedobacter frigidisoli TaxID=2530455 RepID=A0A4R0P6V1_9SPHI|nr:XRE family transcriptional regulator [Pedobacter frigidisoli]
MLSESDEKEQLEAFGKNLRGIRKEKDLSMEALANLAEIELSQIYRIETGKINPKLTTVLKIVKALEITANDLFRCCNLE